MAFCTNCGAQVQGAFCTQCGTALRGAAAGQPAAQPPMQPPPMQPPPPPGGAPGGRVAMPPPVAGPRKTSPIIWILVVLLGLFVLGGLAMVGTGMFVLHKARQAGLDPDLMRRNPGLAVGKLIAAANPDAEVVSTDDNAGTITIRDRKTGKVVTMTFDQAKSGGVKFTAEGDDGKTATMQFGGDAGKLPSWVPQYPGSSSTNTFTVKGDSGDGAGQGGNFTFTTSDSPEKVMSFYEAKAKDLGMKPKVTTHIEEGGMVIATDDAGDRSLTAIVGRSSGETTVNITYGVKK